MRRLLYIAAATAVAVSALTAQTPGADTPDFAYTSDSVSSPDTVARVDSVAAVAPSRRRHVSPVNNAATRTQYVNDAQGDSARMLERRRQRSIHYHDENGNTVMIDTVTGQEWVDSTLMPPPPKMKQPLLFALEAGVNIWDPVMRIFGQKYGGADISVALNLHNRYIPTVEAGLGIADKTPAAMNYTYRTPLSPYFKVGADYNFIYNSDPDYRFVAGVRYGISFFSYSLENVTFNDSYWGTVEPISFPSQKVTAGWGELLLGLRVKIAGPISAGWMFRFHTLLHQTKPTTGNAWYIPGYGTANSSFTGSFSIFYTFGFKKRPTADIDPVHDGSLPPHTPIVPPNE